MLGTSPTGRNVSIESRIDGVIDISDASRKSVTHSQITGLSEAKSHRDIVLGHRHG